MTVNIREARPDDADIIFGFICDLATYEKLRHEVRTTAEALAAQLFGPGAHAEVLIAEADDVPIGFALFFHNFSTFEGRPGLYLEDLYVDPAARGRGAGKAMLAHLAQLATERGCARLEWSVLDWNAPSIAFYRSFGARAMDEWTTYRVDGEALTALASTGARQAAP